MVQHKTACLSGRCIFWVQPTFSDVEALSVFSALKPDLQERVHCQVVSSQMESWSRPIGGIDLLWHQQSLHDVRQPGESVNDLVNQMDATKKKSKRWNLLLISTKKHSIKLGWVSIPKPQRAPRNARSKAGFLVAACDKARSETRFATMTVAIRQWLPRSRQSLQERLFGCSRFWNCGSLQGRGRWLRESARAKMFSVVKHENITWKLHLDSYLEAGNLRYRDSNFAPGLSSDHRQAQTTVGRFGALNTMGLDSSRAKNSQIFMDM